MGGHSVCSKLVHFITPHTVLSIDQVTVMLHQQQHSLKVDNWRLTCSPETCEIVYFLLLFSAITVAFTDILWLKT